MRHSFLSQPKWVSNGALLLTHIAWRHVPRDMVARAMRPPKRSSFMHRSTYTDMWPFQCPGDGVTLNSAAYSRQRMNLR